MRSKIVRAIELRGYSFYTLTKRIECKELIFFEKSDKVRKVIEGQICKKDTIIYPCAKKSISNKNGRLYKHIIDIINTCGPIDRSVRPTKFEELMLDYFCTTSR